MSKQIIGEGDRVGKYLYILRPHSEWVYCGGLICVVARSFDEVRHLVLGIVSSEIREVQEQEEDFGQYDSARILEKVVHVWVLEKTIEVVSDTPIGIVAMSWNYA